MIPMLQGERTVELQSRTRSRHTGTLWDRSTSLQVRSLGREDPLEKEMATHFSVLAWKIPLESQYALPLATLMET